MRLKIFALSILLWIVHDCCVAQTCTITVSGDDDWSTGSWSCTSGSPPTSSGTFTGNVVVNGLGNNESLTVDIDLVITGSLTTNVSGSSPEFIIPSGRTLTVQGDMGSSSTNNLDLTVNGTLNVGGTMELKNNNAIQGTGEINSTAIVVNNNTNCGTGCPSINTGTCSAGNNSWCSGSTINITGGALPVDLLSFSLSEVDEHILVAWSTASEINNQGFWLDKKRSNEDWLLLAEIPGKGTSNKQHSYEYLDMDANFQLTEYYRLIQVDYDGQKEALGVLAHHGNNSRQDQPLLNFSNQWVNINCPAEVHNLKLEIVDLTGKRYGYSEWGFLGASSSVSFPIPQLDGGVYLYRYEYSLANGQRNIETVKSYR